MEITAQKREQKGKKVKTLRNSGVIPSVVFGVGIESTSLELPYNEFVKIFSEAGETSLIDLNVQNGGNHKVLVKDVQLHPVTGTLLHVALYKPNLKEKIEVAVPVEVSGETENPLVKSGEGVLLILMNEIKVKTLPTDIPHSFEINISGITEIGEGVSISDLEYNREIIEIVDADEDEMVVKIDYAQMQEEETEITEQEAIAQVEATEEGKEEEAEGEQE